MSEVTTELAVSRIGETLSGTIDGEAFSYTKVDEDSLQKNRWSTTEEVVVKDQDGRFWSFTYEDPATENQSMDDWYIVSPSEYREVEPVEKTITVYVRKEQ